MPGIERGASPRRQPRDARCRRLRAARLQGVLGNGHRQRAPGKAKTELRVAHLLVEDQQGVAIREILGGRGRGAAKQCDGGLEHRTLSYMNNVQTTEAAGMVQEKCERRSRNRPATISRHEALQAALIDAAERTIAADGLAALRARPLAEEVGCSVGAIYTIFSDLEGVILAVNGRTLAAISREMTKVGFVPDPTEHLVKLAWAYLNYAAGARARWAALFQHTMAEGRTVPDWYARQQTAAFSHIEEPLGRLCLHLAPPARVLLARSLFSAVHGIVALGLDEKVASMPLHILTDQIGIIVTAIARGLVHRN